MNKKFEATLNGKTYTDRQKFLNDFRSMKNSDIKEVTVKNSYSSKSEPEEEYLDPEDEPNVKCSCDDTLGCDCNDTCGCVNDYQCENPYNKNENKKSFLSNEVERTMVKNIIKMFGIEPNEKLINDIITISKPIQDMLSKEEEVIEEQRKKEEDKVNKEYIELVDKFIFVHADRVLYNNNDSTNESLLNTTSEKMFNCMKQFSIFNKYSDSAIELFINRVKDELLKAKKAVKNNDIDNSIAKNNRSIQELKRYIEIGSNFCFDTTDAEESLEILRKTFDNVNIEERRFYFNLNSLLVEYYNIILKNLKQEVE